MGNQSLRQELFNRYGQLRSERASWYAHWQEITTYLLPRNGRYFRQDRNKGYRRHNNIYDSHGTQANNILAAGLMGGLTSPARPWFRLGTNDPDLNQYAPVRLWLSDVTTVMLSIFQRSNTYRALHAIYKELGAFGTAGSIVQEDFDNVIHHYPLTAGEYCLATDWRGNVVTMYREFEKTVGELVNEFGKDSCSRTVNNMFGNNQLDKWIPVIHCVEPRADREVGKRDAKNMPWRSVYFEVGGDNDQLLRESGYQNFPVFAPRWEVAGGDIYGNSPGMTALGDIKQLQHEQLRKANGIDYQTNPPLQLPTTLKNRDVERLPGGLTFVDQTANQKIETMFDVRLDLSHLLLDIQDVRQRISSAFYADIFMMLANDTTGRMTATEVAARNEEKMLMLGPVLERLQNELLDPLIDTTFTRMLDSGIVPKPPPELQNQKLNVELVSVLAQAQRSIATNGIDRFVNNLGAIAVAQKNLGLTDTVADKFKADRWADDYSDMLGVDPALIASDDEVTALRVQRAKAMQAAQQAAMQNQQADTAQKLGSIPTQGGSSTALQDVMGNLTGYT